MARSITRPRRMTTPGRRGLRGDDPVVARLQEIESSGGDGAVPFGDSRTLPVTNLDKVYFPESGHTKGDVMRYYARVAPVLLPLIADRPLVLKRWPDGIGGQAFFQQKAPDNTPDGIRVERVLSQGERARRIVGGDLMTLLYCVQLGVIATNAWHSRIGSLEFPDYTILDLDPGPKAPFKKAVQVARWLKELLDEAGLVAGLKTSGKSGMHVYIPLPPATNDEAARLIAQIFAERVAQAHPKEATTTRAVRGRGVTTVYVDYLQNVVGKSVASAFSVRARAGATVSTPLEWNELTDDLDPSDFTIDNVIDELPKRGRIWSKSMGEGNRLDKLLKGASSAGRRSKRS